MTYFMDFHAVISVTGPQNPLQNSGPWAKMETLGRKYQLTGGKTITAYLTHAVITHYYRMHTNSGLVYYFLARYFWGVF